MSDDDVHLSGFWVSHFFHDVTVIWHEVNVNKAVGGFVKKTVSHVMGHQDLWSDFMHLL